MKGYSGYRLLMLLMQSLLLVAAAGSAVSCSDGDGPEEHAATLYDIVELTWRDGANLRFDLYKPDAAIPAVLSATAPDLDFSEVETGDCVFLAYVPDNGKPYTSGHVRVNAFGTVTNSDLKKIKPENLDGWDADPVYLMSLWRAGNKVCMRFRLTYDTAPRLFALVVDESTLGEEYPTAYLYNRRDSQTPNFSKQYYAAFDVTNLWNIPGCRGVNIHTNNSNLTEMTVFTVENPFPVISGEDEAGAKTIADMAEFH